MLKTDMAQQKRNVLLIVAGIVFIIALASLSWNFISDTFSSLKAEITPKPQVTPGIGFDGIVSGMIVPARGSFSFTAKTGTSSIIVIDITGGILPTRVCRNTTSCTFTVNTSQLSAGSYDVIGVVVSPDGTFNSTKVTIVKK